MPFLIFISLLFFFLFGDDKTSYFLAIKKNEGDVLNNLNNYTPLTPPQGKYYADPFLFKHAGINYIFFEDYDYKKGVISYVKIDPYGTISNPTLALELPIHLSFPHVFSESDQIYMLPETFSSRSISLYKAVEFPTNWKHQRVLIRGQNFSDPILFEHNGYYWLFTAVHMDLLRIYYAKDLDSPFLPHPINHHHIRGRNAGAVYYIDGRPIRPTMDCSKSYGRSMILKEIILLTPSKFIEKEITTILPIWADNLTGTHTYSQNEDYVVYDGQVIDRSD